MKYETVVYSLVLDTIDDYYEKYSLELFSQGKLVRKYEGYHWQFEIGDRIEFYEDAPVGQDSPRTKGDLVFSTDKSNVGEFYMKNYSNEEIQLVRELNKLYSEYLWKRTDEQTYNSTKREILSRYTVSIDMSKFEI